VSIQIGAPVPTPTHRHASAPAREDYDLEPGTALGEYRIEGKIGQGGMGVVFSAVHPLIGKRAAIKILKKELCADPHTLERFVDEARVVNEIGHPNIVDIFAFGEMPDGRSYFVMEWLKGETLRARIARGKLAPAEVGQIVRPLARALEAAHEKGVIHRDLKPDNVFLVDVRGEVATVKLLDFGIAKLARNDHRVEKTATGAIVGTPQYIAPEQAKGYSTITAPTSTRSADHLRAVDRAAAVRRRQRDGDGREASDGDAAAALGARAGGAAGPR